MEISGEITEEKFEEKTYPIHLYLWYYSDSGDLFIQTKQEEDGYSGMSLTKQQVKSLIKFLRVWLSSLTKKK